MGLVSRFAAWWDSPHPLENQASPDTRSDANRFFDMQGVRSAAANIRVDEDSAMRLPVYSGAASLIGGAIIRLPLRVVDREMVPVPRQPPWTTDAPADGIDAATLKRRVARDHLVRGRAVWQIVSWRGGLPWRLRPLPGKFVTLHTTGAQDERREAVYTSRRGGVSYRFIEWLGPGDEMPPDNRCLISMDDDDGTVEGRSTLRDLSPTIALGLAMMEHSSLVFAHPGSSNIVYLDTPSGAEPSVEEAEAFGEAMGEAMDRPEKRHRPIAVNARIGVANLSFSPEQEQLIEARNQVVEEVCRRFGIAPQLLALPTTTWGTGQLEMRRALHQLTIPAWTEPILSALNRTLPKGQRAIFDTSEAVRGDLESEAAALDKLVGGPTWTANEGRAMQGKPPIDGGDQLAAPRSRIEVVE